MTQSLCVYVGAIEYHSLSERHIQSLQDEIISWPAKTVKSIKGVLSVDGVVTDNPGSFEYILHSGWRTVPCALNVKSTSHSGSHSRPFCAID
jgi:hypothetical protein